MSRWLAYTFGLGGVALVASPIFWNNGEDSYPLSTYPMFSGRRDKPIVFFMQGIDAAGRVQRIAPKFVATEDVMQAATTVRRAVDSGPEAVQGLCVRVAQRIAQSAEHAALTHLEIVSARFDPVAYFETRPSPELSTSHFRCQVPRPS